MRRLKLYFRRKKMILRVKKLRVNKSNKVTPTKTEIVLEDKEDELEVVDEELNEARSMSQIVEEIKGSYHPMSSSFIESSSSNYDKSIQNKIRSDRNDAENILLSPSRPSTRRAD